HCVRSITITNCEVHDLWPNAMLEQFFIGLKNGMVGEFLGNIVRDPSAAGPLAAAYEYPETLNQESVEMYFTPFAESAARREQVKGFSQFERNSDQLVAAARGLRLSKVPAQVLWGEGDTAFDARASIEWLRGNLGGLCKVTTIPNAKVF